MGDDLGEQLDLFSEPPTGTAAEYSLPPGPEPVQILSGDDSEIVESSLLQWLFRKEGLIKANLHPTGENALKPGENTCNDCYHYSPASATQGYGPCSKLKAKDLNCITLKGWPACEKFREIVWF